MAEEKFQKRLDHALNLEPIENLDLSKIKSYWRSCTCQAWDFSGDYFDQLGLAGLMLTTVEQDKYLNLIHQAVLKARETGA